jgi:hypothetical protein
VNELQSEIAQIKVENDFKKKLKQGWTVKELRIITNREHPLSLLRQCELLGIHCSGVYFTTKG